MADEKEVKQEKAKPITTMEKHLIAGIDFEEIRSQRIQIYKDIEINLATARTNEEIIITGTYLYALEGTDAGANLDVRFNELSRPAINLTRGRSIKCPFFRLFVTNTAQAGKTLTLIVGIEEGDIFEVIDRNRQVDVTGFETADYIRTSRDSKTFLCSEKQNAVASEYGYVGLKNPAASGVNAMIVACRVSGRQATTNNSFHIRTGDIATFAAITTNGIYVNKYLGGANPTCEVFGHSNVAMLGSRKGDIYAYDFDYHDVIKKDAILLPPDQCFFIMSAVVQKSVDVMIEWVEI